MTFNHGSRMDVATFTKRGKTNKILSIKLLSSDNELESQNKKQTLFVISREFVLVTLPFSKLSCPIFTLKIDLFISWKSLVKHLLITPIPVKEMRNFKKNFLQREIKEYVCQ
jgi:hypothetical protein